jgi:amino acid transporter
MSNNSPPAGGLQRHFGLLHATALNVTMVVGAGVFITIPLMLGKLPGPYALLGWLAAGLLILVDGLVWSELAASFPGSGGSYLYLLESYGRPRWGRLMAFLFIWQFLISGPLEVASGLIAMAIFAEGIHPKFAAWNQQLTTTFDLWPDQNLAVVIGPARIGMVLIGVLILFLLYRRITSLGKLTITFWLGVLVAIGWILVEGLCRFDAAVAFDFSGAASGPPEHFGTRLGEAMLLAMYSYLGYYSICYIGDEVHDPSRTIPRSIILSTLSICVLFIGLHLAMLGTLSWKAVPIKEFSLPAMFMAHIHPDWGVEPNWAVVLVSALLLWTCIGSAFAALLAYARIPYGASRYGHFFAVLGRVHPQHHIPHLALLLVGGLTLFWSFFDFQNVINALFATRILQQFVGQIGGLMLLRRLRPGAVRPYKMVLYPLPCLLALAGWLYLYWATGWIFMALGGATLLLGTAAFLVWSWRTGHWPFESGSQGDKGG